MRAALAVAFALMASGAAAQTVDVRAGDHPGYARIAFDLPSQQNWRFGRDGDGYTLMLDRPVGLDTSRVWPAIGRNRIAGLRSEGARLHLVLGCARCHAVAFETRPGTLVIDVKDGAAKAEARLSSPRPRLRSDVSDPEPAPVPAYDWTALPREVPALPVSPALDPFRDAVLRQIAEGAARGTVDMVESLPPLPDMPDLPPQVRVGEEPGFIRDRDQPLTSEGRACIADDRLVLSGWGNDLPVAQGFAAARQGLEGEFDTPDPQAVERAVRYHLWLGFGAEARQIADLYPLPPEDQRLYDTLGTLVDGDVPQDSLFRPMAGCTGAAALWAVLSLPDPEVGEPEATDAALQAFTALPQHLRRTLAPTLIERFDARGDATSARMVQDAVTRAEADPDPATRRLIARQSETGEAELQQMVAEGGHGAEEAMVDLADRRLSAQQPVDEVMLTALQGMLKERGGGPEQARLSRLVTLGLASLTRFDEAFTAAPPDSTAELWGWLARTGGDESLLRHAVVTDPPALPQATRLVLADRLTALGLPDPALRWLDEGAQDVPERMAAARAQMARRDARAVLRLTAGLDAPEAGDLRRRAEAQLGTPDPAPPTEPLLPPVPEGGPLAQGRALIAGTDEVRARIDALLNATAQ